MLKSIYYYKKNENECFICCTKEGKTEKELISDMLSHKTLNYPLINLSCAYHCFCKNIYAHNICLININKCPQCRKEVKKPNLYVVTQYDFYLKYYFDWIKKDLNRIEQVQIYFYLIIIVIIFLLFLFDLIKKEIDIIKTYSLIFAIIYGIIFMIHIFGLHLQDYFEKYWLYKWHKYSAV
jgi:hypothetical protein